MKIHEIAYHRNGIGGAGFHVVRFADDGHELIASVFEEGGHVAVLELTLLPVIAFGENSWRGDRYEAGLRAAIKAHQDAWTLPSVEVAS